MSAAPGSLVLMTAGGTGGHVYPALAVANELLARGYRVEWVGTRRGLEHRVVPAAGITLHCLPVRGVRGKSVVHKLLGLGYLALAAVQALWLVYRRAPRCVVGMGGYVAGPAGVAAWLLRKPLLIHEQNAVAGTTNRMLAPLAAKVVAAFAGAFAERQDCVVLGNPVRSQLVEAAAARPYDYAGQRPLRLLVLGGSLGAQPINQMLPTVVARLNDTGPQLEVWHQAGDAHAELVQRAYVELAVSAVRVAPFIEDMAAAYAWADLVICRAGALTVSELAVMGRPAILVPLPYAIDDHQSANARYLAQRGAAVLLPQAEMSEARLVADLHGFLAAPAQLATMARAALAAATPEATAQVSDCCEELIRGC
ncbi:MAG: undecaprenyldiphospho-muramoylpentapeptide beta-N-acetylglucosaminyltransferase [Pseudomonadales bacterium]|nr:undecaprenyldiphospho-muramoylpentapeptide beta-N-acetylglucosaminyltransferase [Halieaceae bacterium]MCP5165380.1 undecaprenyldiphospho-muramoylpentapeptide beta-N-acetylglucosaminyltransferase [Pseudomonadales bacterium]MCP5190236.1 undecaprenyldiphospho-muramoylpentapeptide beta-N-acetylglucosaminyltransferase [Pseudomonadales bacterium]MCP5204640.1 undecaprenyldiphospho-muramoylpentapeptide beta-N-acetylglucosaminyltransferase [Pseudomonadales bacterium]